RVRPGPERSGGIGGGQSDGGNGGKRWKIAGGIDRAENISGIFGGHRQVEKKSVVVEEVEGLEGFLAGIDFIGVTAEILQKGAERAGKCGALRDDEEAEIFERPVGNRGGGFDFGSWGFREKAGKERVQLGLANRFVENFGRVRSPPDFAGNAPADLDDSRGAAGWR